MTRKPGVSRWYAFSRLLWRPSAPLYAAILGFAAVTPFFINVDAVFDTLVDHTPLWIAAGPEAGAVAAFHRAVVRSTIIVALGLGLWTGTITDELHASLFAWSIPRQRRTLLASTIVVALLVVVGTGLVFGRFSDSRDTTAMAVVALLLFGAGLRMPSRPWLGIMCLLVLPWVIVRVDLIIGVIHDDPGVIAGLALVVSTFLMWTDASMAEMRRRPFAAAEAAADERRFLGLGRHRPVRAHEPLQNLGVLGQLFVVTDGWPGAFPRNWAILVVGTALVGAGGSYWMGLAPVGGALGGMYLALWGTVPQGAALHPLSRSQRARLVFVASIVSSGLYCVAVGLSEVLLFRYHPFPQGQTLPLHLQPFGGAILPGLVLLFAWSPMLMWVSSQPPLWGAPPFNKVRLVGSLIAAPNILFVIPFYSSLFVFAIGSGGGKQPSTSLWAAMLAVACLVHLAFFLRLRRGYQRRDLI